MPGFLSHYDGTERIDLGDGYWVDVKKCLSHTELQFAQAMMGAGRQNVDLSGRQFATIDMNAFETELIVQSLVDWNIDDPDGTIWPLDAGHDRRRPGDLNPYPQGCPRRQSVARLPAPVTAVIFARCNELNGPLSKTEQARFPDPDGGGDPGWDGGTPGTSVVPDPEGVLGTAGGDEGNPGGPPVA